MSREGRLSFFTFLPAGGCGGCCWTARSTRVGCPVAKGSVVVKMDSSGVGMSAEEGESTLFGAGDADDEVGAGLLTETAEW